MYVIEKKAVIITGAAKRLGKTFALTLASYGYDIVIHYNNSKDEAILLQCIIEKLYQKKCLVVKADFNDFNSLNDLMERAFEAMPYCNVLINNASIFHRRTFLEVSNEDFTQNHNLHVKAPLFLTQYFAKKCKFKGSVINIIDYNIIKQSSNYYAYMLSKKSLANFTQMSAFELAPSITVNAICPKSIPDDAFSLSLNQNSVLINILKKIIELINSNSTTGQLYFFS